MENRYNIDLVEKFRKGEIILHFPKETKTKQDVEDLRFICEGDLDGVFSYYCENGCYDIIPEELSHLPIHSLSDFINTPVDVVVNTTKDGLEKNMETKTIDEFEAATVFILNPTIGDNSKTLHPAKKVVFKGLLADYKRGEHFKINGKWYECRKCESDYCTHESGIGYVETIIEGVESNGPKPMLGNCKP